VKRYAGTCAREEEAEKMEKAKKKTRAKCVTGGWGAEGKSRHLDCGLTIRSEPVQHRSEE